MSRVFVILSTFPSAESAREAVTILVQERLIACGNIVPAIQSIYLWQGKLETSSESLALLKTTEEGYPAAEARLRSLHTYEVPEIVAFPLAAGSASYLDWVRAAVGAAPQAPAGESGISRIS